ncbi:MAG: dihydropteroate synthase [Bacteroidales bacterium]|jgi:dihydropteroate synthase|nr:dihydropteroate synthase [Bacteroidales bacterium]
MILQVYSQGKLYAWKNPVVMGIVNITDDSFFDGGRYVTEKALLERIEQLLDEEADMIDLGAMSTRPGALDLDQNTEKEKIQQAVKSIKSHFPEIFLSIDTWRSSVAKVAVNEGANMINDISGGTFDPKMIPVAGQLKVPYCLMHTTGKPDKMQQQTQYKSLIGDIIRFLGTQIQRLREAQVRDIIIDPGFGFGKTLEQNYSILNNLEAFSTFDLPVLLGISRKSMIYNLLRNSPAEALNGTTVLNTIALMKGARILRVHDVKEAKECVKIVQNLKSLNL